MKGYKRFVLLAQCPKCFTVYSLKDCELGEVHYGLTCRYSSAIVPCCKKEATIRIKHELRRYSEKGFDQEVHDAHEKARIEREIEMYGKELS
jgi:hypothetical protein